MTTPRGLSTDDRQWICKHGKPHDRKIAVTACGCDRPLPRYSRMLKDAGLTKLAEECGELVQIAMKKSAFFDVEIHPDGKKMSPRLIEEMGDVMAAIDYTCEHLGLDLQAIQLHRLHKKRQFDSWKEDGDGLS